MRFYISFLFQEVKKKNTITLSSMFFFYIIVEVDCVKLFFNVFLRYGLKFSLIKLREKLNIKNLQYSRKKMSSRSKKKKFVRFLIFSQVSQFSLLITTTTTNEKKSYVYDTFIRLVENGTYHKRTFNFFFFVFSYLMNFKSFCSNPPK